MRTNPLTRAQLSPYLIHGFRARLVSYITISLSIAHYLHSQIHIHSHPNLHSPHTKSRNLKHAARFHAAFFQKFAQTDERGMVCGFLQCSKNSQVSKR